MDMKQKKQGGIISKPNTRGDPVVGTRAGMQWTSKKVDPSRELMRALSELQQENADDWQLHDLKLNTKYQQDWENMDHPNCQWSIA